MGLWLCSLQRLWWIITAPIMLCCLSQVSVYMRSISFGHLCWYNPKQRKIWSIICFLLCYNCVLRNTIVFGYSGFKLRNTCCLLEDFSLQLWTLFVPEGRSVSAARRRQTKYKKPTWGEGLNVAASGKRASRPSSYRIARKNKVMNCATSITASLI